MRRSNSKRTLFVPIFDRRLAVLAGRTSFFGVPNPDIVPCTVGDQNPLNSDRSDFGRETCPGCGHAGEVTVSPFHWDGRLHLSWRCVRCRQVWVTAERREEPRGK
jgi:hypothetical protein